MKRLTDPSLTHFATVLLGVCAGLSSPYGRTEAIPHLGIFEQTISASSEWINPYREVAATVVFTPPSGEQRTIPLFWDGEKRWTVRFSPDTVGHWQWSVSANDPGLDGVSGSFACNGSDLKGGIRAMTGHPYHFEQEDGTPFWWMGDTNWFLLGNNPAELQDEKAFRRYVDTRASQHFNVVHCVLLLTRENEEDPPYLDTGSQAINPAFWRQVDRRLRYANQRGITVGLFLGWAQSWQNQFANQEDRLRYARYAVARLSAYNVYFVVSGEWNEWRDRQACEALGRSVRQCDPHGRLIGIHSTESTEHFAETDGCSFGDYQQIYSQLYAKTTTARNHNKPVINAEYAYFLRDLDGDGLVDKPHSASLEAIRRTTHLRTGAHRGCRTGPGPVNVHGIGGPR